MIKKNNDSAKTAGNFLVSKNHELNHILQKCKMLSLLNDQVATYLDPHIKDYCHVANLVENQLVIIVANGSIATQLRFLTPDLLRKWKTNPKLSKIKSIHCKVQPSLNRVPDKSPKNTMSLLSKEQAEMMQAIAESITDPKLREIMLRLATHVEKSN